MCWEPFSFSVAVVFLHKSTFFYSNQPCRANQPTALRSVSSSSDGSNPIHVSVPSNNLPAPFASNEQPTTMVFAPLYALLPPLCYTPPSITPVGAAPIANKDLIERNSLHSHIGQEDVVVWDNRFLDENAIPNVRIDDYTFPAVSVPSSQKHQILLYNIDQTDQCYVFRFMREKGEAKVYGCVGCYTQTKSYAVTVVSYTYILVFFSPFSPLFYYFSLWKMVSSLLIQRSLHTVAWLVHSSMRYLIERREWLFRQDRDVRCKRDKPRSNFRKFFLLLSNLWP